MHRTLDRLRAARREDRGFTLIELLIVIIILGVLAAIVVFSVRGITNNSEAVSCDIEVRTVETAVEAHYAEENAYPADVQELVDEGYLRDVPTGESAITGTTTVDATGALSTTACDA